MKALVRGAVFGLCAVLGMACATPANAALGSDPSSVARDMSAIGAVRVITPAGSFAVHEGHAAHGAVLREYVDGAGRVFALTFRGPHAPDLNGLLGSYSSRYLAAAKARHGGHHLLTVRDADLEITVLRTQRYWSVEAVLPKALPAGVTRDVMR